MVVLGSWAHIPFSWSQLSSVLQQPRSFPRSCWSALSSIAPEENSLGPYQEMQAKATTCSYPLQGAVMVMKLLRHTRENPYFTMQPLCRTSSLCSCLHVDPSEMLSNLFLSVPGLKGVFSSPGLCCYFTPFMTSLTLDFQDRVQCSWSFPEGVSWLVLVSRVVSSNPRGQHEGDKWLMLPLQHPRGWVSAPADLSV